MASAASPVDASAVRADLREWVVAGALVEDETGLLLVQNRRHSGRTDWSPPGGVIDAEDATLLAGLGREVEEETGLRVLEWEGPVYEVHAVAVDLGWTLRVEVHRAVRFEGELSVEDPDGIVVDAAFLHPTDCAARLEAGAQWVAEPLGEWLEHRWGVDASRRYAYRVHGTDRSSLAVHRAQ